MPYPSHLFCPPLPQPETPCRRGKEEIRRHQCRRLRQRQEEEEHMDRAPSTFMRASPRGGGGMAWHGMYLPQAEKTSDDTWGSSFAQRGGSSSCSHTSRATTTPPPPTSFLRKAGWIRNQACLVEPYFPLALAFPSPTHGHREILIRPPQCPCRSSATRCPLAFVRSFLTHVPGRAQWGWGGPNREGFETSLLEQEGGTEGLKHAHHSRGSWHYNRAQKRNRASLAFTLSRDISSSPPPPRYPQLSLTQAIRSPASPKHSQTASSTHTYPN